MTNIEMLDKAIKNSGVSITFLADKCGISRTALYTKLQGGVEFKQSEIAAITEALHLTVVERDTIFFAE